jgi:hypothetical protein
VFTRPWTNRPQEFRGARWAFTAAMFAAGLALFVVSIPGESQACGRDADGGVTITTQAAMPHGIAPATSPEEVVAEAMAQPIAVSAASAASIFPARSGGNCCGGASHSGGGTCAGGGCSMCSATIPPAMLDVGLDMSPCNHAMPEQAGVTLTKPDTVFHPPRLFV